MIRRMMEYTLQVPEFIDVVHSEPTKLELMDLGSKFNVNTKYLDAIKTRKPNWSEGGE